MITFHFTLSAARWLASSALGAVFAIATYSSCEANPTPAESKPHEVISSPVEHGGVSMPKSVLNTTIQLGVADLDCPIPGRGYLTEEQIRIWIENPEIHTPLQIELPLGLGSGAGQVQIPTDNPMTRARLELGRQLFFDKRLSSDNTVSCADCHDPAEGYARNAPFGVGVDGQEGTRNAPAIYNRILSGSQFWDGRAASLEEQAIGPITNPIEMGNTHEQAVKTINKIAGYRIQFEAIFPDGVPIGNIGKAIANFERAIVTGASPNDYYQAVRSARVALKADLEDVDAFQEEEPDLYAEYIAKVQASEKHAMSKSAKRGLEIFFSSETGCAACHVGANLTDEQYHNIGIGMDKREPDLGRFAMTKDDSDRGAFKTPTLRNVALTAPYMHDGSLETLEEVVQWYAEGGYPNLHLSDKIKRLDLSDQEKKDLVEFLKACTGKFPAVERGRLPE